MIHLFSFWYTYDTSFFVFGTRMIHLFSFWYTYAITNCLLLKLGGGKMHGRLIVTFFMNILHLAQDESNLLRCPVIKEK